MKYVRWFCLTVVLLIPMAVSAQTSQCPMIIARMGVDAGSAGWDCGTWAASDGFDTYHLYLCTMDFASLTGDLIDFDNNDCGSPIDRTSPGSCDWWDLWCAATNIWNRPWTSTDWNYHSFDWRPCPCWEGPQWSCQLTKDAGMRSCTDILAGCSLQTVDSSDCILRYTECLSSVKASKECAPVDDVD